MPELSSTMFYKVKFSIAVEDAKIDVLWKIVLHIRDWQINKCAKRHLALTKNLRDWTRLKFGAQLFSKDNSVFIKSEYFSPEDGGGQFWACQVIENLPPQPGCANREWVTEIGYEQAKGCPATFSCVVFYSDRAGFIGPYMDAPEPSIPNLIRNIIADKDIQVFCGSDVLTGRAEELRAGDWPKFYTRIVNPERQLPYIFISPQIVNWDTKETIQLVRAASLADRLFGNALVFFTTDSEFSVEMRYMNDDYACYGGAIRIYQPNTTDPTKHRYLSATDVETYGEKMVVSFLVRAFSQNIHFYDTFFCIDECQKKKIEYARKKRLENLHAAHQKRLEQAEDEKNTTFDLAAQEEEKRLKAESELENISQELNDKKQENYNLKVQVEQLQAAAAENSGLRLALDARFDVASLPETAENVIIYFSKMFADKLVFSEDARKSVKACTLPPAELWKIFFALANTMLDLYKVKNGDIFAEFRKRTGIEAKRGEGSATRNDKKLMKQFKTEFNGKTIDVEAHITYPKQKQSIHFGYSDELKKIVIGHCGEHLDNYSTRKVK